MVSKLRAAIIGATGYSGVELIRILSQHPHVEIAMVISTSQEGQDFSKVYPHLKGIIKARLSALEIDSISQQVDLVFFATPARVAKDLVPRFRDNGVKCIDISGDFRFKSPEIYQKWYQAEAANEKYLKQAVYGLSEINSELIKNAELIANPGCYPTATLLGLIPAIQKNWINPYSIIVDAKSGVSGAGRTPAVGSLFAEVNENLKAYKLGTHQHLPEIEQAISDFCRTQPLISFTTHLIPMNRGIMCTIYANLIADIQVDDLIEHYQNFYYDRPFIRIRPSGTWPSTKEVYGSNYCDIGFFVDQRTRRLTIVSVIDNLVKGAAGQAVQNLNIMYGWNEATGLYLNPLYP